MSDERFKICGCPLCKARNANCASPKKGRRKDPFIFRRTTVAAAAAFYTEITGLLNTAVSLAAAAWKMDSHVCNL